MKSLIRKWLIKFAPDYKDKLARIAEAQDTTGHLYARRRLGEAEYQRQMRGRSKDENFR